VKYDLDLNKEISIRGATTLARLTAQLESCGQVNQTLYRLHSQHWDKKYAVCTWNDYQRMLSFECYCY